MTNKPKPYSTIVDDGTYSSDSSPTFISHSHPTDPNNEKTHKNPSKIKLVLTFKAPPTPNTNDTVNIALLHRNCLRYLWKADPNIELITRNPDKTILHGDDPFPEGDDYKSSFFVHTERNKITVSFELLSALTLQELKNHDEAFFSFLRQHNLFLRHSISGSDQDQIVVGALLGLHPEKTHRKTLMQELNNNLQRLAYTNDTKKLEKEARENLQFDNTVPFQLQVLPIKKTINEATFTSKAIHIIAAKEHSNFVRSVFIQAQKDKALLGLGNFFSYASSNDYDTALKSALEWHNTIINLSRPIVVSGISSEFIDEVINTRNTASQTTLRSKIIQDGKFISFMKSASTNTNDRWIGVTCDYKISQTYISASLPGLYTAAFPLAKDIPRIKPTSKPTQNVRDYQFENNTVHHQSWAEIASKAPVLEETDDRSRTSFIARSRNNSTHPPLKIEFTIPRQDDFPSLRMPSNSDSEIKSSAGLESVSETITKADLDTLRSELLEECRSFISELSSNSAIHIIKEEISRERDNTTQMLLSENKKLREEMQQQSLLWSQTQSSILDLIQAIKMGSSVPHMQNTNEPPMSTASFSTPDEEDPSNFHTPVHKIRRKQTQSYDIDYSHSTSTQDAKRQLKYEGTDSMDLSHITDKTESASASTSEPMLDV